MVNALRHPLRYGPALRVLLGAKRVPADAGFDRSFAFVRSGVGITQQEEELRWLWELVQAEAPRRVLEIGVDRGGTMFMWTRAAAPDALLVGVDLWSPGPGGNAAPFPLARRRFARPGQRIELLLGVDSHDPATVRRVDELLGGEPVDFLFIDGDHTCEGVQADFDMYVTLVRPGGIVAFHDVAQWTSPDTEGVAEFWRRFTAGHATEERVVGTEPGYGIGVYRVPAA
jgi:predicted O-methyltransferase YrrM